MTNELTTTKQQTAKFVHDAMEMETAVFTLERAIDSCVWKKNQLLGDAQAKVDVAKAELDRAESDYKAQQNRKSNMEQERISPIDIPSEGASVWLILLALLFTAFGIIMIIIGNTADEEMLTISPIYFLVSSGCVAILLLIGFFYGSENKADHAQKIKEQGIYVQKAFENIAPKQATHSLALSAYAQARLAAEALDAQIATLKSQREQIRTTLIDFYALNVIKPKYRNIECAVIMNELYENDRVDTMREAMDKCDARLFQNEVLQIGHNIQAMLGKMTIALVEISDKLDSINSNVKIMSQDLYTFSERIAQGQKNQQAATDELIRETQLSRYASERVAASASYLEWHQRNQNY